MGTSRPGGEGARRFIKTTTQPAPVFWRGKASRTGAVLLDRHYCADTLRNSDGVRARGVNRNSATEPLK